MVGCHPRGLQDYRDENNKLRVSTLSTAVRWVKMDPHGERHHRHSWSKRTWTFISGEIGRQLYPGRYLERVQVFGGVIREAILIFRAIR